MEGGEFLGGEGGIYPFSQKEVGNTPPPSRGEGLGNILAPNGCLRGGCQKFN